MRAAWVAIGVILVLVSGCAQQDWIDRTLVTVDVTGAWQGKLTITSGIGGGPGITVALVLQERGAKVPGELKQTGSVRLPGMSVEVMQIEGRVSGDTFTFHEMSGHTAHGEFRVNGDEMIGSFDTSTLRRQQ